MIDVAELSLLGGHPALDLVNTIEDRDGHEPDDVLRSPQDLARWGRRAGLKVPAAGLTDAELAATLRLREDLHAVLRGLVTETPVPPPALHGVEGAIREAHDARRLAPAAPGLGWVWPDDCRSTLRYEVALAAAELLTDPSLLSRTRLCSAQLCGWFYLDQSKNGSRRWCSMQVCGTREKARRRAARSEGPA